MNTSSKSRQSAIILVIATGLLAGTLDGFAAVIHYYFSTGNNPGVVFKYIASGILGNEALSGGPSMVFLGVLLHYKIVLMWTVFFYFLYPKLNGLITNPWLAGVLIGIFVWIVMNLLVLPLSNVPQISISVSDVLIGVVIIILTVGFPISYKMSRYYQNAGSDQ
jgi:hypothetical protein